MLRMHWVARLLSPAGAPGGGGGASGATGTPAADQAAETVYGGAADDGGPGTFGDAEDAVFDILEGAGEADAPEDAGDGDDTDTDPGLEAETEAEAEAIAEEEAEEDAEEADDDADDDAEDADDADDDAEDPGAGADASWPKSAVKRVGEITGKLREAEAHGRELSDRLAAEAKLRAEADARAAAGPAPPSREDPLSFLTDEAEAAEFERGATEFRNWLTLHPDGGTFPGNHLTGGQPLELDADQVLEKTVDVQTDLGPGLTAARARIAKQTAYAGLDVREFPDLVDPGSALSRRVNEVLAGTPELRRLPSPRLAAGALMIGDLLVSALGGAAAMRLAEETAAAGKAGKANGRKNGAGAPGGDAGPPPPDRERRRRAGSARAAARPVPAVRAAPARKVKTGRADGALDRFEGGGGRASAAEDVLVDALGDGWG